MLGKRRLQRGIMLPAMIAAWITGPWLAIQGGWLRAGWLHGKLLLVVLLTGLHGYLSAERKRLAAGRSRRMYRYFSLINEL